MNALPEVETDKKATVPETEHELPNLTNDLTEAEDPREDRPSTERQERDPTFIQPVTEIPDPQREVPETLTEAATRLPIQLREEPTATPP